MSNFEEKVRKVLDEVISPALRSHGGGVELLGCDEEKGEVRVRLSGACMGCPFSQQTLRMQVEMVLKREVPEVRRVVSA